MPPACLRPGPRDLAVTAYLGTQTPAEATERPLGGRVALLCNGPSLAEVWDESRRHEFSAVVGVNSAGWVVPVEWMVASDAPLIRAVGRGERPKPARGIVCYRAYEKEVRKAGLSWRDIPSLGRGWKPYTFPRAILWVTREMNAEGTIEIFGCDWSADRLDAAGVRGDHGLIRWKQEAACVAHVWDRRIAAVHGRIAADRLAFFRRERADWPG